MPCPLVWPFHRIGSRKKKHKGHVKVFELHEKVACVGHIQHHKDQRPVKDGLLAFQIGDYLIHSLREKVF